MIQKSYDNTPTVYIIPTPIGNMDDITYRALDTLKKVAVVFSEDTRVTSQLFTHFNIKNKLISSHKFNEAKNKEKLLEYLNNGFSVGVVSDRGTPAISDPGYELIKIAIQNNYNVVSLPGATAFVPAVTASGINTDRFLFYGFLNQKTSKLEKELEELKFIKQTIIFYESPHRIMDTLNSIKKVMGNRSISISREISKLHEEVYRGKIDEIIAEEITLKGEFVIVVAGNEINCDINVNPVDMINEYIKSGMSKNDAIKLVAATTKRSKSEIYKKYHEK